MITVGEGGRGKAITYNLVWGKFQTVMVFSLAKKGKIQSLTIIRIKNSIRSYGLQLLSERYW
jgi:uncharacterized protein YcgL (UPF0745 family)